jgi:hypothetical protein
MIPTRATAYVTATRLVQGLGGVALLVAVAAKLGAADQGEFFTIASLSAIQAAAEMGLTTVLVQVAAHLSLGRLARADELAHLDAAAAAKLGSLLRTATAWLSIFSFAFLVVLLPAGCLFFEHLHAHAAIGPWCLAVLTTALGLLPMPALAVQEGCGGVAGAWRIRLLQQSASAFSLVAALLLGAGSWAIGLAGLSGLLAAAAGLALDGGILVALWRRPAADARFDWWREVWPFQWRISASYLCGIAIFHILVPTISWFCGAIEAGRFGLSNQALRAVSTIALSVVSAKAQRFGSLIAQGERAELDRVFNAACVRSLWLGGIGIAGLVIASPLIGTHWRHWQDHVLDARTFVVLAIGMFLQHAVLCLAIYLRAHREEPLLVPSVLGAIALGLGTPITAWHWGVLGVSYWFSAVTLVLGLGAATVLVHRRRTPTASCAPEEG